jgi:hypothetical protein
LSSAIAVANGRKASTAYLTSYENAVLSFADSYEKAAGATRVEWVASIAAAQADFTREVTKAYTGAARELVSGVAPASSQRARDVPGVDARDSGEVALAPASLLQKRADAAAERFRAHPTGHRGKDTRLT